MERDPNDWWEEDHDDPPNWFAWGMVAGMVISGALGWFLMGI